MKPVLYTTGCPRCKVLKAKLDKANIEYDICDNMDKIEEICLENGVNTVPLLKVGDDVYTFSTAIEWVGENVNAD